MADDELEKGTPSLEPPSLGFRRKRRVKAPPPEPAPATEDRNPTTVLKSTPPAPASAPALAPAPWARRSGASPAPAPAPAASAPAPAASAPAPPRVPPVVPATSPTPPLFADERQASPTAEERPDPPARPARDWKLPALGGLAAAVVTGLVIGLLTVGATTASLQLCVAARGTTSCGNPGFLLLLAILVAMILLGSALLRAFGVPSPGSTSFLAVSLLAVLILVFLVNLLFEWWIVFLIPVLAVLTYALSWWVTTTNLEPGER